MLDTRGGVKGIGLTRPGSADPQFTLGPGAARDITVEYAMAPTRATVLGTVWAADFAVEQLEVLPSRQIRSIREYIVSFQGLTAGRDGAKEGGDPGGILGGIKKILGE